MDHVAHTPTRGVQAATPAPKRLNPFERYLSLWVALCMVAAAVAWTRFRPRQGWWWLTFGFMALSLGPFVIAAGINTYVPGPWALMRYVPVVNAVRTPTRFATRRSMMLRSR